MKRTAPYKAGDRVAILHDSAGHGTALAVFTVARCVALATNNTWRVEVDRCDGTQMHVVVNERGRDRHGYLERVR